MLNSQLSVLLLQKNSCSQLKKRNINTFVIKMIPQAFLGEWMEMLKKGKILCFLIFNRKGVRLEELNTSY